MRATWSKVETVVLAIVLGAVALAIMPAARAGSLELKPLSVQEMAYLGATHCLDLSYDMPAFTSQTTSNTAVTVTNALPAGSLVEFVRMKLDSAWDGTNTESVTILSGIASDTDHFLTSTQIASDGTEVFYKSSSVEFAFSSQTGTNCVTGITNTNYPAWYIAGATNILTTLTPDSLSPFSQFTSGRVRLYFRIYSP